ncbi:hypothetical protein BLOT_011232 [Blomia tropicalis]|nr:hypothetical protein BLOT_011232 [Blomia tropicalis]
MEHHHYGTLVAYDLILSQKYCSGTWNRRNMSLERYPFFSSYSSVLSSSLIGPNIIISNVQDLPRKTKQKKSFAIQNDPLFI